MSRLVTEIKKHFWPFVVGIGVLIGLFYTIDSFIEKRISDKLKDHEVIRQIASLVRPSCVFDDKGTIIHDSGAEQFIKNIDVRMGKNAPEQILVSPTEHLNVQPFLECINYNYTISAERINKSDWQFKLSSPSYVLWDTSGKEEKWLFRLEIMR